jgi:hypothetical protein
MIQGFSICCCALFDRYPALFIPRREMPRRNLGDRTVKSGSILHKGSIRYNNRLMGQMVVHSFQ